METTFEHIMIECPLGYDSIDRLEEKIETILNQFGSKTKIELFQEDDERNISKAKIAIGIIHTIPKIFEKIAHLCNSQRNSKIQM